LPRVGGALSGALEGSIVETGARVKRRVRVRPCPWRERCHLNQGVSLKEIGDQLGHRDLDTTRIYAKVDLTRLRAVADFKLGGLL
jgi:integrase